MSVPTDYNIALKEYNEISKKEIEKIWHLKTTIAQVIVGALSMIKEERDR